MMHSKLIAHELLRSEDRFLSYAYYLKWELSLLVDLVALLF